jgi:hypothetical protein
MSVVRAIAEKEGRKVSARAEVNAKARVNRGNGEREEA